MKTSSREDDLTGRKPHRKMIFIAGTELGAAQPQLVLIIFLDHPIDFRL